MTAKPLLNPVRATDSPATFNEPTLGTVRPSIGVGLVSTEDLAADLFAEALRAVQTMVVNAAEKSMPKLPRWAPKFELAAWDERELVAAAAMFAEAVRVVAAEKPKVRRVA
jgi:hypothetical protein